MAEDFLEEIYEDAILLFELKREVELAYLGHGAIMVDRLNALFPKIGNVCNKYAKKDYQSALKLWNCLDKNMVFDDDLIALADRLERFLIPTYKMYLMTLGGINVEDENGLRIQSSDSGFLTLVLKEKEKYIHSVADPMWEAYLRAKQMFRVEISDYYFVGSGLGYLPYQIFLYSEGTAKIHIFETDDFLVEYGKKYGVLEWIPKENLDIVITKNISSYIREISNDYSDFDINMQLTFGLSEKEEQSLSDLRLNRNTNRMIDKITSINYCCNLKNVNKTILDFDKSKLKKEFIVVGGGPSVDYRIEYLRDAVGKKTIFAVGTIFSKLIKNNIIPDAVVFLDPMKGVFRQAEGLLNEEIPIFIRDDTCKDLGLQYKGEKYLALGTKSIEAMNEGKLSPKLQKVPIIGSGSTVTTFATNLAIYYGATKIELIGADFAYPHNMTHAEGTIDYREVKSENLPKVKSVNGELVSTDNVLSLYCRQMEEIIESNPHVAFYNLSPNGAEIKGTKWISN